MLKVIVAIVIFAGYSVLMFYLGRGYGIEECSRLFRTRLPYKTWLKISQGIDVKTVDDLKNEIKENQRSYVKTDLASHEEKIRRIREREWK